MSNQWSELGEREGKHRIKDRNTNGGEEEKAAANRSYDSLMIEKRGVKESLHAEQCRAKISSRYHRANEEKVFGTLCSDSIRRGLLWSGEQKRVVVPSQKRCEKENAGAEHEHSEEKK